MPLFLHDASSFPPTSESCTTYICRVFFLQTSCFSFSSSIFLFLFFRKQDRGGVMKHILMNNSATTRLLSRPGQQLAHPVPTRVASCTTHAAVMVRTMDFTLSVHTLCGRMPTIPSSCPVFVHPSPPVHIGSRAYCNSHIVSCLSNCNSASVTCTRSGIPVPAGGIWAAMRMVKS